MSGFNSFGENIWGIIAKMSMWCNRKNLVPKNVSCLKKGEILNKTPDQLVWYNLTLVLFNSK